MVSRLMRQILVDHARARMAQRRDKRLEVALEHVPKVAEGIPDRAPILVRLDEAIQSLAKLDERKAQLIELRYFGGLTAEESAEFLSLDLVDVRREIRYAQNWLKRAMGA